MTPAEAEARAQDIGVREVALIRSMLAFLDHPLEVAPEKLLSLLATLTVEIARKTGDREGFIGVVGDIWDRLSDGDEVATLAARSHDGIAS